MEDKSQALLTEPNKKRIYSKNAIEKMIAEMPADFSEMQKARYIYINLGKLVSYDERFTVGNAKAQRTIYRLARVIKIEFDKIVENQKFKGICTDLNRLYASVLNSIGISAFLYYGHGMVAHDSVAAQLDGNCYFCDMQRDLANIQLNCRTHFFGSIDDENDMWDRYLTDKELKELDRSIGFKNYDYSGSQVIANLRSKFQSAYIDSTTDGVDEEYKARIRKLPFKDRVEEILREIALIPGIKDLDYTERTAIYTNLVKYGLANSERNNFRVDNLYTVDEKTQLPAKATEVFTVVYPQGDSTRFARYIYDREQKEYVQISNKDLMDKIKNENLKSKREIAGLRKIIRESQKDIE